MQEVSFLNQNGFRRVFLKCLFVFGVCLLLFPVISEKITRRQQKRVMNSMKEELLGELKIPSIDVHLPIYKDVEEEQLEKGVGHMKSSNLPGSGKSTHCLLVGHRGLPRARLLSRLGEVKVGEHFSITIGKKECRYRVCEIRVIRPDDIKDLSVYKDLELVSVITCTPYGINTHRLVVTGERIH